MRAEILAIGSEITSGHVINSNAAYLAQQLARLGIACQRHAAVPDDPASIIEALREALRRADVVITTGGLGPTFDDVTAETIARATGRALIHVEQAARHVRRFYRLRHRRVTALALRQALLPDGATALPNPAGTAPGIWLPLGRLLVVALPGVPREMQAIMREAVVPRLQRRIAGPPIASRTLRTSGLVELEIQHTLARLRIPAHVQVGLYPHLRTVDVRLTVSGMPAHRAAALLDRLERALRARLGEAIYGVDDQTIEAVIGHLLTERRLTIALAESCTGGSITDRLTNVPGSSGYLLGSVVAYANPVKHALLGVSESDLARHGAVSPQVARAMAQGVRARIGTDVGLSVTGIAGPSGGSAKKPVGLVYIGFADERASLVLRCHCQGDRLAIKQQAVQVALDWLRRQLLHATSGGHRLHRKRQRGQDRVARPRR